MKSINLITFLIFTALGVSEIFGQSKQKGYTISVEVSGFKDSTLFFLTDLDAADHTDSARLKNNKLFFSGRVNEPSVFRLYPKSLETYCNLWVENKAIKLAGSKSNFRNLAIKGSGLNDINAVVQSKHARLDFERDSLANLAFVTHTKSELRPQWIERLNKIDDSVTQIRLNTIATLEPSLVTAQELYFLRNDLTTDSLQQLFNRFPASLKNTRYGDVIQQYIITPAVNVGSAYTDIAGKDLHGQPVRLSNFKGKVILLDFWASWCGPCRQANGDYKALAEKYKQQGFEMVSFSVDTSPKSWKKGSAEDGINWTNMADLKGLYSKAAAAYKVRGIPRTYLIDRNGIIAAVYDGFDSSGYAKAAMDNKIAQLLKPQP